MVIRIYYVGKKSIFNKGKKEDFVSFKSECFSPNRQMATSFGENVDKDSHDTLLVELSTGGATKKNGVKNRATKNKDTIWVWSIYSKDYILLPRH